MGYDSPNVIGSRPTPRRFDPNAPKRQPLGVPVDYSKHESRAIGEILGVRWGLMQGWEKVDASAVQPPATYTFDLGLTLTGSSVNLDPATPAIIGGITEAPSDGTPYVRQDAAWIAGAAGAAYTFDTGLTLTGSSVNLDPATATEIGGITEPATDGLWLRSAAAGAYSWAAAPPGTAYVWGIGIDEGPPGTINLIPATAAELGGVTVVPRSDVQGLDLAASGALTAPLATDLLAGSIVEPLPDGLLYVRTRTVGGVSSWVPQAAGVDFGLGLSLNDPADPADPKIVNLTPAGHEPRFLGGVYGTGPRTATEGLDIDPAAGRITVPLATNLLAGSIVEPPTDGIAHTRQWDIAGQRFVWTPAATAGLQITGLIPEQVIIPSTTPVLVHAYGMEFTATCEILLDGVPVVPPAALISPTEMTFTMDPTPETVMRSVIVTVRDTVGPVDGAGAESFVFAELVNSLYRGRWQPGANTPDIGVLVKEDQWMWIADTVDPLVGEVAPAALPGIGGQTINEGDHIIWDATAAVFFNITGPMRDFGVGLSIDRTASPPIVNLTPAGYTEPGDPGKFLGGVFITPATGLGLNSGTGELAGMRATETTIGMLFEAPLDAKNYVRKDGGWAEAAAPTPDALPIAGNSATERGVVWVPDDRGLNLDATGQLWLRPATSQHLGGFLEPTDPTNTKTFMRRVGGWVENTAERVVVAGDNPGQKGIVYVPDRQGLALAGDGRLTLAPTTPSQMGGIIDAPFSDPATPIAYVRQNAAWVEAAEAKPVRIAGTTPAEAGIVYVVPKLGISLNPDGGLAIAPSTPTQVGGLFDAPWDTKAYVRQNAAWVESSAATQKLYGVGLIESLDKTRVDLKIAGLNDEIGGVRTFARGPTNALEFDNQTGVISVPLATDRLPGALVEPDGAMGGQFARTFDGTTGAWVPVTSSAVLVSDTPPATPTPNTLWWDSDSGNLFVAYQDVDSTQWVQINTAAPPTTGIADAPNDGQPYNRQSGGWTVDTAAAATVGDVKAGFQPSDHAGWIKLDGRAVTTLTATQQAAAATLGFTTNLPDADNAVPLQSSTLGPLAQGGIAGSMSRDIVLTQANLPAVDLAAESAGDHSHLFDVREGAADKNFWGFVNDGRDAVDWAADVMIARSHAAGGTVESAPKPIFRDAGAHTHTVALGGSGTAIKLDITPKAFAANYFCYLGA